MDWPEPQLPFNVFKSFSAVVWLSLCACKVIHQLKSCFQLNKTVTDTEHGLQASLRACKFPSQLLKQFFFFHLRLTTFIEKAEQKLIFVHEQNNVKAHICYS